METLVELLKKETESLKAQYLAKTEDWAKKYYAVCDSRKRWFEVEWCKFLVVTPELVNKTTAHPFLSYPKGFHNTAKARELDRHQNEVRRVVGMGLEKYLAKELKYAELHYENSILKLAARIEKKGLDTTQLKTVTSHIGVNIETVLTDGKKVVKAFTIIAEGEIQRPHYRYLIK